MEEEKLQIIMQLIESMSEATEKLEAYYEKRDLEDVKKAKQAILYFQKKISNELE